jgi:hypothetical protein
MVYVEPEWKCHQQTEFLARGGHGLLGVGERRATDAEMGHHSIPGRG